MMSNALDMSLDDLIKSNKKSGGGGNPKSRRRDSGGPGPTRRAPNRSDNRSAPYSVRKVPDSAWQHDMYSDQMLLNSAPAARISSIETGTKLYISNLDYGVSTEDIKELFSEFGDLKRFSIHYDRSGRSKGTADVVFARKVDALAAVRRYDGVQLDGKPMKLEIVGTNIEKPSAITRVSGGGFGNSIRAPKSFSSPEKNRSTRSGGGRRRGRGRGKGREQVSASDLDADLEKYHADAMQS